MDYELELTGKLYQHDLAAHVMTHRHLASAALLHLGNLKHQHISSWAYKINEHTHIHGFCKKVCKTGQKLAAHVMFGFMSKHNLGTDFTLLCKTSFKTYLALNIIYSKHNHSTAAKLITLTCLCKKTKQLNTIQRF